MKKFTDQEISVALQKVPRPVQDKLTSGVDIAMVIGGIGRELKLHIDQIGVLAELNRNMLLGLTGPQEFLADLLASGIADTDARQIMSKINEKIFAPLHQQLRSAPPAPQPILAPRVNAPLPNYAAPPAPAPSPVPTAAPVAQAPAPRPVNFNTAPPQVSAAPAFQASPVVPVTPKVESAPATAAVPSAAPLPPKMTMPRPMLPVGEGPSASIPRMAPPPPTNLPGALTPPPAMPPVQKPPAPTRPPYSSDPYREPLG